MFGHGASVWPLGELCIVCAQEADAVGSPSGYMGLCEGGNLFFFFFFLSQIV